MSLRDRINDDMKAAMRAKDSDRLGTIRMLLAAAKQREVDERITLDDTQLVAIVDKLIKQRKDSITAFTQGGRQDLADKEAAEVRVLEAADTIGGGLRTTASTLPGFVHDVCAAVLPSSLTSPFFQAFGLAERVEWIHPDISYAHPLDGGRAGVAWRDIERTAARLGVDERAWLALLRPLSTHIDGVVDFLYYIKKWKVGMPNLAPPKDSPQEVVQEMLVAAHFLDC